MNFSAVRVSKLHNGEKRKIHFNICLGLKGQPYSEQCHLFGLICYHIKKLIRFVKLCFYSGTK